MNLNNGIDIENLGSNFEKAGYTNAVIIRNLLYRYQKLAVAAPKGSLKSSIAVSLAISVANENKWLNYESQIQGKVLFVNLDQSKQAMKNHFYKAHISLADETISMDNIDTLTLDNQSLDIKNLCEKLITEIQLNQYNLIIIDSLDNLTSSQWNLNSYNAEFNRLCQQLGCSLVFTQSVDYKHRVGNKETLKAIKGRELLNYSDVYLEFVELDITDKAVNDIRLKAVSQYFIDTMKEHAPKYFEEHITSQFMDYVATPEKLLTHLKLGIKDELQQLSITDEFKRLDVEAKQQTYWRCFTISSHLPQRETEDYIFKYPLLIDGSDLLHDYEIGKENTNAGRKKESDSTLLRNKEKRADKFTNALAKYIEEYNEYPTQTELAKHMKVERKTVRNYFKDCQELEREIAYEGSVYTFL